MGDISSVCYPIYILRQRRVLAQSRVVLQPLQESDVRTSQRHNRAHQDLPSVMKIILLALFVLSAANGTNGQCFTRDYSLYFPRTGITDYVSIKGMPSLKAITACIWIRSNQQLGQGLDQLLLFSYAKTAPHGNDFAFVLMQGIMRLYINNDDVSIGGQANDGQWHHLCAIWESSTGAWNITKDGARIGGNVEFQKNYTISGGGVLVLGQEQDVVGGGFDAQQCYVGDLGGANVWNRVLTTQEISKLSECCHTGEGNVFKWYDFRHQTMHGNVKVNAPSLCQNLVALEP